MSTVSIAMATYNGARFLREQLDSLAAQTLLPTELVITDDGSDDDTLDIINDFARTVPFPVHLHRNEKRLGYKQNFMNTAALCSSELIFFSDQDDVWHADKIQTIVSAFSDQSIDFLFHNFTLIDENGDPQQTEDLSIRYKSLGAYTDIPGLTQAFRRRLLAFSHLWSSSIDHNHSSEPMAHDQWFYFLADAFGSTRYLDHRLLGYRQHTSNLFGIGSWNGKRHSAWAALRSKGSSPELIKSSVQKKRALMQGFLGARHAASLQRSQILSAISDSLNGRDTKRIKATDLYSDYSKIVAGRLAVYESPTRGARLSSLVKNVCSGYYAATYRGIKDLMLDFAIGVFPDRNSEYLRIP